MDVEDSYVILYEHDTYTGATLYIYLKNGGRQNIWHHSSLHDEASSFKLHAPSNVEVRLGDPDDLSCAHGCWQLQLQEPVLDF